MGKTEEDQNGLQLELLKTVHPNCFSKFIFGVCNFKNKRTPLFLGLVHLCKCDFYDLKATSVGLTLGRTRGREVGWMPPPSKDFSPIFPRSLYHHLPFSVAVGISLIHLFTQVW